MTVNGTDQRKRRSVRRRLIQTTLFADKSSEIYLKVDRRAKEGDDDDYNNTGDFCGSHGKKKGRKRKVNGTPQQNRASKKAKEKSPKNTTPRKIGMHTLIVRGDVSPPPIPNLRVEAKLTAEENLQMFGGSKIHPLFASQKKLLYRSNKAINIGPIHVFERTRDDAVLDWKDWTFLGDNSIETGSNLEGLFTSVFESNVEDPRISHFSDASFVENKLSHQCANQDNDILGTALDEQLESYQLSNSLEGADNLENSELEHQRRLLQEGFVPSYHNCTIKTDNSLWTDKYHPKSATEVCGNTESVKFMNEWLHLWRKRRSQSIKTSNNIYKSNMQEDDDKFCRSSADSEIPGDENSLKNVLLVTGPIGSGKSAAIYACAREQGFTVVEFNASDYQRAFLQDVEHTVESRYIIRPQKNPALSLSKHMIKSPGTGPLSNSETVQEFDNEAIELIAISDEEVSFVADELSETCVCDDSETGFGRAKRKPVVLFEDVDIICSKYHGFIAAIEKIAKKAKWPIILTSNSKNLVLPNKLDRAELCFRMPSQEEWLHHLNMVCAVEKASIQPHLLEQLSKFFQGDLRKAIMHLQFWCQSKKHIKDRKLQKTYGLLLFDIEDYHSVLPTIIPWDFPSQLSELVEKEISKRLSMEVMEMHNNEIDRIAAKKEVMVSRNISRRTRKRKLDVVLSPDIKGEYFNKQPPLFSNKNVCDELFIEEGCRLLSHRPTHNCIRPLKDKLLCYESNKFEDRRFEYSEKSNNLQIETCKSMHVSHVPKSSFLPETQFVNGMELPSRTVSHVNVAETTEISESCKFREGLLPVEVEFIHKLVTTSDTLGGTCSVTAEASPVEVVENSQNEYNEAVSSGQAAMDECHCMNFNKRSSSIGKFKNKMATDLVQESWIKLRESHADLTRYVGSEPKDAFKILKQTSRMSDLISQADQLLSKWQMQDYLELLTIPSENLVAVTWCDEQLQIANTVSKHGFCLYAKEINAIGSKAGLEDRLSSSQEMLSPSNITAALGRLLGHDARTNTTSVDGKGSDINPSKWELPVRRDLKSCLFNVICPMVPKRSFLALKGASFHEYISSLKHISRSEASRLSAGVDSTIRRTRRRGARHYLSTGALMLSPEDISLLDQYNFNGKLSSNN